MTEINRIASEFLRQHMSNDPSVEFHKLVSNAKVDEIHDPHEAAVNYLQSIQSQDPIESERILVSEPTRVNILRVVKKGHPIQPAFLNGFRKRDQEPVWTFDQRLACVVSRDKADELLGTLKGYGFECFILPAPETQAREFVIARYGARRRVKHYDAATFEDLFG